MSNPYPTPEDVLVLAHRILTFSCEADGEPPAGLLDPDIVWFGTSQPAPCQGRENLVRLFGPLGDQAAPSPLSEEDLQARQVAPGIYLVTGRVRIAADPASRRVTLLFRWDGQQLCCCHIHLSISDQYLQEQTALLERLRYQDSFTGAYNRSKYDQLLEQQWDQNLVRLGIACFDLNGLKRTNDLLGHSAGDTLIQQMARYLEEQFPGQVYRVGGDEFLILDDTRDRQSFQAAVREVQGRLDGSGISSAVGTSWRSAPCSLRAQTEEADSRMRWDKHRYYDELAGSAYRPHHHED